MFQDERADLVMRKAAEKRWNVAAHGEPGDAETRYSLGIVSDGKLVEQLENLTLDELEVAVLKPRPKT